MMKIEFVGTDSNGLNLFRAKSAFTGKLNTMALPVSPAQIAAWQGGRRLIQECFPTLSDDEREFLMSGSTPEEWDAVFGQEEE